MALTPGTRVGAFEILGILGRGGMGEVYRAQDTALGREVAIKILPEVFAADPDRSARFALEARVLASLNHPNVGAIYGLEEKDGVRALVLELVEGPTLADRIVDAGRSAGKSSGLPLDEVLSIAEQIAAAAEAAHEQGVIHRDLKPANVKLRPDGTVKVLDFGLAKLAASGLATATAVSAESPTMTSPALMTQYGVILGTAGYMSPEQARGKVADKRSDVWAFGCVLYEMLTGRRAFPGDELADTMAAVLRAEPDWSALPSPTPTSIRRLLERSLRKDPRQRLPEIGSARLEIAEARAEPLESPAATATHQRPRHRGLVVAAALLTALLLGAAAARLLAPRPSTREIHLEIATPPTTEPVSFALSPDGRAVAFVASVEGLSQLWVRSLDTGEQRPLKGTDGATYPFWSPDSRSIGFFADQGLQRIDLDGAVRYLSRAPVGAGGTWNDDGVIVFSTVSDAPLSRTSAAGGDAAIMPFEPPGPARQRSPRFLPDGNSFLYYVLDPAARGVYLGALDRPERVRLLETESAAVYANGELLFARAGTLYAQRFDPDAYRLLGSPQALAEGLAVDFRGVPAISVSRDGAIAYRIGSGLKERQLKWLDRTGAEVGAPHTPDRANPRAVALSPDGRRVAMSRLFEGNGDIWVYELERRLFTRVTFDPAADLLPHWSPDGKRVVFSRATDQGFVLLEKVVDDPGDERSVYVSGDDRPGVWVSDWSASGWLLATTIGTNDFNQRDRADVLVLAIDGGSPVALAQSSFDERSGEFSPDGKWVSYVSDESGLYEVFVQRFPESGQRLQVSSGGGRQPVWRPDGREIFYLAPDGRLMAASLREHPDDQTLEAEAPVPLFMAPVAASRQTEGAMGMEYAVSPDGERFLVNAVIEQSSAPIQVILHRQPIAP